MIDLHLHTTASDGLCSPDELVSAAHAAGLRVIAVADHDTLAATGPVKSACERVGLVALPAVEITAVHSCRDVHLLGYFVRPTPGLTAMLDAIRAQRERRARVMVERLAGLGLKIDDGSLFGAPGGASSVARPAIARALVAAGHVAGVAEAFDLYLSEGRPAYVAHAGPPPTEVVDAILEARGFPVLAHPGTSRCDDVIEPLASAGLGGLEAYHSAHDDETMARYVSMAGRLRLEVTGGSDYHGPGTRRAEWFGRLSLPRTAFAAFCRRAARTCDVPAGALDACAAGGN